MPKSLQAVEEKARSSDFVSINTMSNSLLHNAVTLPTLLYNAETWPLNEKNKKEIDKMEI